MNAGGEKLLTINGLGKLPAEFSASIPLDLDNSVTLEDKWIPTHSAEGDVIATCKGQDDIADDSVEISGQKTPQGYRLELFFNSESKIGLFSRGRVELNYDAEKQEWSSLAAFRNPLLAFESRWLSSEPGAVLAVVKSALSCFMQSEISDEEWFDGFDGIAAAQSTLAANSEALAIKVEAETQKIEEARAARIEAELDAYSTALFP